MIAYLAGSCFPNCHPANGQTVNSGSMAFGLAVVGILILIIMKAKGK